MGDNEIMRVLIIGKSIVKNENAGATTTHIQLPVEPATIDIGFHLEQCTVAEMTDRLYKEGLFLMSYQILSGNIYCEMTVSSNIVTTDIKEKIERVGAIFIDMEIKRPLRSINHKPIPEYSYSYNEEFMADCHECTARFPFNERGFPVAHDDHHRGEDVCPFCHEELNVEYESIQEAIERVGFTS